MSNEVAETILNQLGWKKFIALTWAKDLVAWKDSLQFKIPKTKNINSIYIKYDYWNDIYNITFYNIKWFDFNIVSDFKWVYFDKLKDIISLETWFSLLGFK